MKMKGDNRSNIVMTSKYAIFQNLSGKFLSTLLRDARNYPDLVNRLHAKTRLMCNSGLKGGVPWLFGTMGLILYLQKRS